MTVGSILPAQAEHSGLRHPMANRTRLSQEHSALFIICSQQLWERHSGKLLAMIILHNRSKTFQRRDGGVEISQLNGGLKRDKKD